MIRGAAVCLLLALLSFQTVAAADIFKCAHKGGITYNSTGECKGRVRQIAFHQQEINRIGSEADSYHGVHRDGARIYVDVAIPGRKLPPFILDTGATITAIPTNLAAEIGLACGENTRIDTANGVAQGCFTRMIDVEISGRRFPEIKVVVLPRLQQPLLGMTEITRIRSIDSWVH